MITKEILEELGITSEKVTAQICEHYAREFAEFDFSLLVNDKVRDMVKEKMKDVVASKIGLIIDEMIDEEYQPKTEWNQTAKTTTLRNEICEAIKKQAIYNPKTYNSDNNVFTNLVISQVKALTEQFKKEFDSKVNALFVEECFKYAQEKLQEKLKLTK